MSKVLHARRLDGRIRIDTEHAATLAADPTFTTQCANSLTAGWSWDGAEVRVHADRLGVLPIYYYCSSHEFICSNSIVEIAKRLTEPELNVPAILVFLKLSAYVGKQTLLKKVFRLEAGSCLSWDGSELREHSETRAPQANNHSRRGAAETYIELMRQSVFRRINRDSTSAVTLSAGRDSRHIAFEMARQNFKPCSVTVVGPSFPIRERVISREIAGRLGLEHFEVEQQQPTTPEMSALLIRQAEFENNPNSWRVSLIRFLRDRAKTVFDGIGGDMLSNGLRFDASRFRALKEGHVAKVAAEIVGGGVEFLRLSAEDEEAASELLAAALTQYLDFPNPWSAFLFFSRTRRRIGANMFMRMAHDFEISCPYLDADVVSFLLSLPGEKYGESGFHDEAITIAYPEFRDIPYLSSDEKTQRPRRGKRSSRWRELRFASTLTGVSSSLIDTRQVVARMTPALFRRDPRELERIASKLAYIRDASRLTTSTLPLPEA